MGKELYQIVKNRFEEHQNQQQSLAMAKYMKNQFIFYGISALQRKTIYKDTWKQAKKDGKIDWPFLKLCYEDEHREFQYLVIDYLFALQSFLCFEDIVRIEPLLRSKQWWDSIDGFDTVIGDIGLRDKRVNDVMLAWSMDENFWMRRLAIDHQLNRKAQTDTDLLKQIILNNLGRKEFFINKAIGWSLREYSKTDPQWVKEFLDKYRDKMDQLSIREAEKYIR